MKEDFRRVTFDKARQSDRLQKMTAPPSQMRSSFRLYIEMTQI